MAGDFPRRDRGVALELSTLSDGFEIEIDPASKLIRITWPADKPDLALWRAGFNRVMAHPCFRPEFDVFSDRRQVREPPDSHFVREFIAALSRLVHEGRFAGRWATVTGRSEPSVYGMARMTEILSEHPRLRYRAFNDPDQALVWLGKKLTR